MENCENVALAAAVMELEKEMAAAGWEVPPSLFALMRTQELLDDTPELPQQLRTQLEELLAAAPDHITPVAQDDLPAAPLSELLAHLVFPEPVIGVAVCMERIILPPKAEQQAPADEPARTDYFLNHPEREDARMVVGVMRDGASWCAIRLKSKDSDDKVAGGANLVPQLIEVLAGTLHTEEGEELVSEAEVFPQN